MTNTQSTTYSRDEIVSELTSFYEFLVSLHLPPSALKIPPPGGWPRITPAYLSFLNKNDTVVDLIRHIPFIRQDWDERDVPFQIYEKTAAVDYDGEAFRGGLRYKHPSPDIAGPMEEETTLPAHVMTLAQTRGGRDGYYFFLDTERGTVTMCDFQVGRPSATELSQTVDDGSKEDWREFGTYTPKDFFEMLKEDYRSLKVIPIEATEVEVGRGADMERLKDVYREFGWPSEHFRKEECMKKVKEVSHEI